MICWKRIDDDLRSAGRGVDFRPESAFAQFLNCATMNLDHFSPVSSFQNPFVCKFGSG
jgi:hypothetical protein